MELEPCRVCGEPAHGPHFGILTCRPCSAFFRRTVALKIRYKCRNRSGEKCSMKKPNIGRICPACRFQHCLLAGMDESAVQKSGEFANKAAKLRASRSCNPDVVIQTLLEGGGQCTHRDVPHAPRPIPALLLPLLEGPPWGRAHNNLSSNSSTILFEAMDAWGWYMRKSELRLEQIPYENNGCALDSISKWFKSSDNWRFLKDEILLQAKFLMRIEAFRQLTSFEKVSAEKFVDDLNVLNTLAVLEKVTLENLLNCY